MAEVAQQHWDMNHQEGEEQQGEQQEQEMGQGQEQEQEGQPPEGPAVAQQQDQQQQLQQQQPQERHQPKRVVACHKGRGRVAGTGFADPSWVEGRLFVYADGTCGFLWTDEYGFLIDLERMDC
jgi:hypothetical protein